MEADRKTYDVPYLVSLTEIINKHLAMVDKDQPVGPPNINDETELLVTLMGLSRMIEYNMRVAFEKFEAIVDEDLGSAHLYKNLLSALEPYSTEKAKFQLLQIARQISNGLVHSNFTQVYEKCKEAYELEDVGLHYSKFDPPIVMFQSTITEHGLHVTVQGDTASAKDSKGNEIHTKTLRPDGTNEIDVDFRYFWQTGSFIFAFDVLYAAYSFSVIFRGDVRTLVANSSKSTSDNSEADGPST